MLRLVNVSKYYSSEGSVALGLRNINIEFQQSEFVALVGESGSGKTTLLNVMSGIDTYEEGEMFFNGKETSYFSVDDWETYRKNNIGFVFQNYNIIDSYTVLQNVETVLLLQGVNKKEARKRALEVIKQVGLSHRIKSRASKLSGGEKQRTVIARAIASNSPILVCDEPTGNLDSESGKQVMKLIHEVSASRLVIVVTHDFKIVEPYATRRVRLFDGEIVEDVALKTSVMEQPTIISKEAMNEVSWKTNLLFAMRNLLTTPKRTIFALFVYIMVSFFVAGLYESAFANTVQRYYGNDSPYRLTSPKRIIVSKPDKMAFTEQEIISIESMENIEYVYQNDYYLDNILPFEWETKYGDYGQNLIYQHIAVIDETLLEVGRMPQNELEVVITRPSIYMTADDLLGANIVVGPEKFTVVGVLKEVEGSSDTNSGISKVYGSEHLGNRIRAFMVSESWYVRIGFQTDYLSEIYGLRLLIDDTLADNEMNLSLTSELFPSFDSEVHTKEIVLRHFFGNDVIAIPNAKVTLESIDAIEMSITMNLTTAISILNQNIYQITIMLEDAYLKDQMIQELSSKGYWTQNVADSQQMSAINQFGTLFSTLLNGVFSFIGFITIYFVAYLVLSLIMSSKKVDYSILRIIGANQQSLNRMMILENLFLACFAYFVTIIGTLILGNFFELGIFKVIQYGEWMKMVGLFIIISILGLYLGITFNRKLFKTTINRSLKKE